MQSAITTQSEQRTTRTHNFLLGAVAYTRTHTHTHIQTPTLQVDKESGRSCGGQQRTSVGTQTEGERAPPTQGDQARERKGKHQTSRGAAAFLDI